MSPPRCILNTFGAPQSDFNHPEPPEPDKPASTRLDRQIYHELLNLVNERSRVVFVSAFFPDFHSPILNDWVSPLRKVIMRGQTFGTASRSKRNSFILFRLTMPREIHAGQITHIFTHMRREGEKEVTETFISVKRFTQLDEHHQPFDPYRAYPDLNTCLCYANLDAVPTFVIHLEQVVSHFAAYFYVPKGIDQPCVVVRSLDQVRPVVEPARLIH